MAADGQERSRRKPIVTPVPIGSPGSECQSSGPVAKPTPAGLGVDLAKLDWQRSGAGAGSFEVAFVAGLRDPRPDNATASATASATTQNAAWDPAEDAGKRHVDWVLLRVADDPAGRVLVYDRNEWMCFLDGAWRGEFDRPEGLTRASAT
jgi:hypothetical protein